MVRKLYANDPMKIVKGHAPYFEIQKKLGEGATSQVFKAKRWNSEFSAFQTVALKVLKSRNQIRYLKQEFEKLKSFRSRFCVQIYSWEDLDIGTALVLEYVDGLSLFELGRRIQFLDIEKRYLIHQIYHGLLDLKGADLYHGDLNPKNIMLKNSGEIRLLDLGSYFSENEIFANPDYLAPGLIETRSPNFESDLYALQVIKNQLENGSWGFQQGKKILNPSFQKAFESEIDSLDAGQVSQGQKLIAKRVKKACSDSRECVTQRLYFKERHQSFNPSATIHFSKISNHSFVELQERFAEQRQKFLQWPSYLKLSGVIRRLGEGRRYVYSIQRNLSQSMGWFHRLVSSFFNVLKARVSNVGQSYLGFFNSRVKTSFWTHQRWGHLLKNIFSGLIPLTLGFGFMVLLILVYDLTEISGSNPVQTPIVVGHLDIRSDNWVRVSLNGLPYKYTPIKFKNLRPGRYKLRWESDSNKGQKSIVVKASDRIRLQL